MTYKPTWCQCHFDCATKQTLVEHLTCSALLHGCVPTSYSSHSVYSSANTIDAAAVRYMHLLHGQHEVGSRHAFQNTSLHFVLIHFSHYSML